MKKQIPQDLTSSEAFLDSLIEHLPNMVFVKEVKDLTYVRFNRAGEVLTGFNREELIGKSDLDFYPREQAEGFRAKDREVLSSRSVLIVQEELIQTKDGSQRILRTKKVPIFDANGNPQYLLGMSEDITDLRRAEEERNRFFTSSLDLLIISSNDGYFKTVSPVVKEILGYTPEEICAIPYLKLIHPEDVEPTKAEIQRQMKGGSVFEFENRYLCKDGSYKWMSWRSTPIGDVMYGIGRDVTKDRESRAEIEKLNRELELRVEARTHQLQVTANRFKNVVSSNMMGIIFSDETGTITEANEAFLEMTGYTRADLQGHRVTWKNLTPAGYEQADAKAVSEIIAVGRCKPYEKEYFCKDGSRLPVTVGAAKLDGVENQGVCYVIDLTESKRVEKERNALFLREQAALTASQLKSEFLANMSHEIRTPMNGIIGMMGLLSDTSLQTEQKDYVEAAKASADALLTVINDILDFSKVEAGKIEFEDIDFELPKVFEEVEKSFLFSAQAKGLALVFEIDSHLPRYVGGDPGRIRQVLNNLISNALKFTLQGDVKVKVSFEGLESSGEAKLRVEILDSGIGISESVIARMFKPFSQADASTTRKFGGTGLGLSISKHLVENMKGEIGVQSKEGHGSKFWFTLLLRSANAPSDSAIGKSGTFAGRSDRPFRVLVAEDNPINQKIALKYLEKMGLRADAVANGIEVLEALHTIPYDLILMDCQMPELDGYEATMTIRASLTLPNPAIPIVAMTANAMAGERERCLAAGMNDYVSKPVKPEVLFAVLEQWL